MELTGINSTNQSYFDPLLFLDGEESDDVLILLGVIHAESPVAAAAFSIDVKGKVGRIVSIYTRPDMRRKKAATMLMNSIDVLAKHYKLLRMECYYTDNMNGLDAFFKARKFDTHQKNNVESVGVSDLLSNKPIQQMLNNKKPSSSVQKIGLIETNQKEALRKKIESNGYGSVGKGIDEDISMVALPRDECTAAILCSAETLETIIVTVMLLVSFTDNPSVTMGLLIEWIDLIVKQYGEEAQIDFYSVNPSVTSFIHSLATPKADVHVMYGEKSIY
jgi:N-acetylglutamate synthase-like GNAT family acetyltransferase